MWKSSLGLVLTGILVAACSSDPQYIGPPAGSSFSIEFDSGTFDPMNPPLPVAVTLPFRLETPKEAMDRAALTAQLGVMVPYIRLTDVDLSIEWSLKNLLPNCEAEATFNINGGNEFFIYDPLVFQTDPEEPPPPPLLGNMAPIHVPAGAVVSGVFREDQIVEASIDVEQITRAARNPKRALNVINKNDTTMEIFTPPDPTDPNSVEMGTGVFIPREAWALMTEFSMAFTANGVGESSPGQGCGAHLVFEWDFRARDKRGVVHDSGLDANPAELTVFAPATYMPM